MPGFKARQGTSIDGKTHWRGSRVPKFPEIAVKGLLFFILPHFALCKTMVRKTCTALGWNISLHVLKLNFDKLKIIAKVACESNNHQSMSYYLNTD